MRRIPFVITLAVVAACSRKSEEALATAVPVPVATVPDHVFGIVLRRPLDRAAIFGGRCISGRQFALMDGTYDIVSDDILASATEEHQDTAAVLAALDSLTACMTRTRERGATAVITLVDTIVGHAVIYWPDGGDPSYDSMVVTLAGMYGEPYQNPWGVRFWAADSMSIYLNKRSLFGRGTAVTLTDARLCGRYERLVHQRNTRDRHTYPCWKKPERLDPGEVFTDPAVPLADSDLVIADVPHRADSSEILRSLGPPSSRDLNTWTYAGLRISLDSGRVRKIALTSSQRATRRGLRVGDRTARAKELYGTPCIREIWAYCRTVTREPDPRGMMLQIKDHVITEIWLGTIFGQ